MIMIGTTGQDVGRQGRITEVKPIMLEIEYRECQGRKLFVIVNDGRGAGNYVREERDPVGPTIQDDSRFGGGRPTAERTGQMRATLDRNKLRSF
jgi:hypothetical protein